MNKWQDLTDLEVNKGASAHTCGRGAVYGGAETLDMLAEYCRCAMSQGFARRSVTRRAVSS